MAPALAEVIHLDRSTKSLSPNGFSLVKPCSLCDRPAAFKVETTTGLEGEAIIDMRACVEHLAVVIDHNAEEVERWNAAGHHPALFPWVVTVGRYQR